MEGDSLEKFHVDRHLDILLCVFDVMSDVLIDLKIVAGSRRESSEVTQLSLSVDQVFNQKFVLRTQLIVVVRMLVVFFHRFFLDILPLLSIYERVI